MTGASFEMRGPESVAAAVLDIQATLAAYLK